MNSFYKFIPKTEPPSTPGSPSSSVEKLERKLAIYERALHCIYSRGIAYAPIESLLDPMAIYADEALKEAQELDK